MSNFQKSGAEILNQIRIIYCTQLHLYERCTELVDLPQFKEERKTLNAVIDLSARRVRSIENFYSSMGRKISFQNCDALIGYLEEKFAPNYKMQSGNKKRFYMNNYIINIHWNAKAADILIKHLMVNQKKQHEINKLLKEMNLTETSMTL
jgi:hypothetical protein